MDNDKSTMLAVVQLQEKYNFKSTNELFRKEANLQDVSIEDSQQTDSEVTSILFAYKSEGNLALYEKAYSELKKFVEEAMDIYKFWYTCMWKTKFDPNALPAGRMPLPNLKYADKVNK